MDTQYLFAYGTLKSDQTEHARHCSPPLSIIPAKVPGELWRLREGYPILQIDPAISLLDATASLESDLGRTAKLAAASPAPKLEGPWVRGELFTYPATQEALQKMDTWENFRPGVKSPYQRRMIWTQTDDGEILPAWAYVCYTPPNWATLLDSDTWQ